MTTISVPETRLTVKPTLVYWHCNCWWPIEKGPTCSREHDPPIYDDRPRRGRKRRVWICTVSRGGIIYFSREDFLEHDEGDCYDADF